MLSSLPGTGWSLWMRQMSLYAGAGEFSEPPGTCSSTFWHFLPPVLMSGGAGCLCSFLY